MKKPLAVLTIVLLLIQSLSLAWAWEIERPSEDIDIKEREESANTNGEASVGLGVAIDDYDEGAGEYGGADYMVLNVSMTANSRKGITYASTWQSLWWVNENELAYRNDFVGVGDEWGTRITFPSEFVSFRFYGGPGSGEYKKVWISSNGFISFDHYNFTSPSPSNIPDSLEPNAVIAAVWTDLDIDGASSIITGLYELGYRYFVITWNNTLHKASGERLTFQIVLRDSLRWYEQSKIWINYKSVTAINTDFASGIEDQQGYKGLGGIVNGENLQYFNDATKYYYQDSNTFFLKRLRLNLRDDEPRTRIRIHPDDELIRGYNVLLKSTPEPETDESYMFKKALAGTATLLLGQFGGIILVGVTVADCVLVYLDWVEFLAKYQYSKLDQVEMSDWAQEAYIQVPTVYSVVDATLSIVVHWIFDTPNDSGSHSLTITANATYDMYDVDGVYLGEKSVTTSVNLRINPDDNNTFNDSRPVIGDGRLYSRVFLGEDDTEDFYQVYANQGERISVYLYPPNDTDFDMYLYNPNRILRAESAMRVKGLTESIVLFADLTGEWFIKMQQYLGGGFYSFRVSVTTNGFGEDKLLIKLYPNAESEWDALERGEIDITEWPLSKEKYDRFTSNTTNPITRMPLNEQINVVPYGDEYGMFMLDINNNNNEYLGNPPDWVYPNPVYPNPTSVREMRQAIAHLTDRAQLAGIIQAGFYTPLYTPVPPSMSAYQHPDIRPGGALAHLTYPYSRAAAEAKLDAGGFPREGPDGPRYWDRNQNGQKDPGEDLDLKFFIRSDQPHLRVMGDYIAVELEAVGVNVTRIYGTKSSAFVQVMINKDFHLYTGYWRLGVNPDFLTNWSWRYYWHPGASPNYVGVNDPEFDDAAAWVRYADTQNEAVPGALWAQEEFASEALSVPLWSYIGYKAMNRLYTGGNAWLNVTPDDGENDYRDKLWEGTVNKAGYGIDNVLSFLNMHPQGYQRTGTLRYGFSTPKIVQLNPIYASTSWERKILNLIYDTLLKQNPNNPTEFQPWLAEQWEVGTYIHPIYGLSSKIRFTLRSDATWQDGTPITTADVEFTFVELKRILNDRGLPNPWWFPNVENILDFKILDPYNFEVLLGAGSYWALNWVGLNIILPKHIWKPIAEMGDPQAYAPDSNIIGSAAWRFAEYLEYSHVLLRANRPGSTVTTNLPDSDPVTSPRGYWRYHPTIVEAKVDQTRNAKVDYYTQPKTVDYMIHNRYSNRSITMNVSIVNPDGTTYTELNITITAEGVWTHSWTGEIKGKKDINVNIAVVEPVQVENPYFETPYSWKRILWGTIQEDITGSTLYDDIGFANYPYKSQLPSPDIEVNIRDVTQVARAFGTYPGYDRWSTVADIIEDYEINIRDTAAIAKKFGWEG